MLSLLHPEIMAILAPAGPGLFPIRRRSSGDFVLAIKGGGDLAIAAKTVKRISFHVFDIELDGKQATAFLTAIYDRTNSPLTVSTICSDPFNSDLVTALMQDGLHISFFDTHCSELYGGKWSLRKLPGDPSFLKRPISDDHGPTLPLKFHVEMHRRYSTGSDGEYTIEASMEEESYREDAVTIHVSDDEVRSRGRESLGVYESSLYVRQTPGVYHEPEIARQLGRIFGFDAIYVGPGSSGHSEFCDILALHGNVGFCVQAKSTLRDDIRTTEAMSKRGRRMGKLFESALSQTLGTERWFYELRETVHSAGAQIPITPENTLLVHIIVIPEKTSDQMDDWAVQLKEARKKSLSVVVLDNAEFQSATTVYRDPDSFLAAMMTIVSAWEGHGEVRSYFFSATEVVSH